MGTIMRGSGSRESGRAGAAWAMRMGTVMRASGGMGSRRVLANWFRKIRVYIQYFSLFSNLIYLFYRKINRDWVN
jgi:hypothetical protein